MSDEFERLRERLERVDAPDQWAEIVARAGEPEQAAIEIAPRRRRSRRLAWASAAAAVLIVAIGWIAVANRRSGPSVGPATTVEASPPTTLASPVPSTSPTATTMTTTTSSTATTSPTAPTDVPEAVSGSWTHACTDQTGTDRPAPGDDFADDAFGPLTLDPGLRIVLPIANVPMSYSQPIPSTARVPGGLLVMLNASPTPSGESSVAIAVVDDDGGVRWRRCLTGVSTSSLLVDPSGERAVLQAYVGPYEWEWWGFDLATGASTVLGDDEAAALLPPDQPWEVQFDASAGSAARLHRVDATGAEIWHRDDLFAPPGEGFYSSSSQTTSAGDVTLVRGCLNAPFDGETACDFWLFGIATADGHTMWQLRGNYGVSLVQDGYAIVTADPSDLPRYELIDLATGEAVPGAISDQPGAFIEECCGGYDTNRVESAGSLAWTISNQVIDVWFPADRPGPGTVVDLFGSSGSPQVTPYRWWPVSGDCASGPCVIVRAAGSGFTPGDRVDAGCFVPTSEGFVPSGDATAVTVAADGSVWIDDLCRIDQREQVVVTIDGVSSPAV